MQLHAAGLRHGRESLDAVNLKIWLAVAGNLDELQQL
jgi:hypothetical protein